MRFFTLDWWQSIQERSITDPAEEYRNYIAEIRAHIPTPLLALQETISLHDGNLRHLHLDVKNEVLRLEVSGDDGSGGLRYSILLYGGVYSLNSSSDPERGLPGPCGYGDWGYDEVDVDDDRGLIHRVLFSTGIELEVRFTTFELRQS